MSRKIGTALLAAALVGLLAIPALAVGEEPVVPVGAATMGSGQADPRYSGPLDPLTGLPAGSGADMGTYYRLKDGEYGYDQSQRAYVNFVGGSLYHSSVPNGAVVPEGQSVSVTLPSGMTGTLYRNGTVVADADLENMTESGSYYLEVRGSGSGVSVTFSFQIVGTLTNSLTTISLPSGFAFDYINLNNEALTPEYANYLDLLEDGTYEISWSCPEINRSYRVSFTLDTTAPTLALPEVTNGQAHSQVTVEDLEPGCYIVVERDGQTSTITSPSSVIREAGAYTLTVCDQAGNSTQYSFVIHVYLNLSAVVAIGLVLAGLTALWAYSHYIRKYPRVG